MAMGRNLKYHDVYAGMNIITIILFI
jgi:hypothetical protein